MITLTLYFAGICPYPSEVQNANMEVLGRLAGIQTIYTCHENYFFPNGTMTIRTTCDPSGLWDINITESCGGIHQCFII